MSQEEDNRANSTLVPTDRLKAMQQQIAELGEQLENALEALRKAQQEHKEIREDLLVAKRCLAEAQAKFRPVREYDPRT